MSKQKQIVRENFRRAVFKRDGDKCRICGQGPNLDGPLDAHHITDRSLMPNGGYVKENGITLCGTHHLEAETFHISGGTDWVKNMHPDDLYKLIGSSREKADAASEKLD